MGLARGLKKQRDDFQRLKSFWWIFIFNFEKPAAERNSKCVRMTLYIYIYVSMYFDASFCVFTSCVFLFLSASSSSCVLCVFMWVHAFYVSLSCFMCLDVS